MDRHVYEVDDDDPPDIPQPELAHDLPAGFHVGPEDGVFEVAPAHVAARIHIDDRHRLGVVDDDVSARGKIDPAPECFSRLFVEPQPLEKRHAALAELDRPGEFGRDGPEVVDQPPVQLGVIHQNAPELGSQQIAHRPQRQLGFGVYQRGRPARGNPALHARPDPLQEAEVAGYGLLPRAFGGGTDDHPSRSRIERLADRP